MRNSSWSREGTAIAGGEAPAQLLDGARPSCPGRRPSGAGAGVRARKNPLTVPARAEDGEGAVAVELLVVVPSRAAISATSRLTAAARPGAAISTP